MSIVDIFEIIGGISGIIAILGLILSIIGLFHSHKANDIAKDANESSDEANKIAKDANVIAKDANKSADEANKIAKDANAIAIDALKDSQKDYIPLVRFVDQFDITSKTIKTLRNENTFDFDKIVLKKVDFNNTEYSEDDELVCVTATIENCGKGIIRGITINSLLIKEGNKVAIDNNSQEELDTLCFINNEEHCTECFVLLPEKKTTVNFMISNNVLDRMNENELIRADTRMKKFKQDHDNVIIALDLKLDSINDTCYKQDFLVGTFLAGNAVHNSFTNADIIPKKKPN